MKRRTLIHSMIYAAIAVAILSLLALVPRLCRYACGNYPIRFYGRTVDAAEKPIGGVTVEIEILHYTSFHLLSSGDESKSVEQVTSDRNGNFELTGADGRSIRVLRFRKDGQELHLAFPPRDARRPVSQFSYADPVSRSQIPDTRGRRLDYPVR